MAKPIAEPPAVLSRGSPTNCSCKKSPARKDQPPVGDSAVKQMVEQAAQDAKAQSVEKTLTIKELRGGENVGYYFSATDRAPKADEYKYLTQGMFGLGEVLISFTILT